MTVGDLARELGTTDRTLRRLAEVGTIGARHGRRSLRRVLSDEEPYLRSHWDLLSQLRAALRTEPRVVAALLFGSAAVGTDTASSDPDLLAATDDQPTLRHLQQPRRP